MRFNLKCFSRYSGYAGYSFRGAVGSSCRSSVRGSVRGSFRWSWKKLFLFAVLFSCFFVAGCKKQEEQIVFDDSYPLALSPSVEWAVVKEPYAALRKEPDWSADVVSHCRRGEILQVTGRSVDSKNEKWCSFENGWLAESCLGIYGNRYKAERISKILLSDDNK